MAFLAVVLVVSHLLRGRPAAERWFLVAASAFFYGQWNWQYLLLIYFTISVDFFIGQRMYRSLQPKLALCISLIVNLGILAFFKYANFLLQSTEPLLTWLGVASNLGPLDILLPVGISFYTFQSLSYTIDRYRGHMEARTSFRDYALFVSFFPQLVAGPIVRASEFFEQLDGKRKVDFVACQTGFLLITVGLVKKVVFADNLAPIADPVFDNPTASTPLQALIGLYAFAFQIYFDFSGYSDIAIGAARLLGFQFPKNFDHPYVSLSIREFWRRWHMTLSRWLRDYLYIGLGGNRRGDLMTARNLMLTMLLGGLWHGASWNFVLWGGLHGLYLALERYLLERFHWWREPTGLPMRALRWLVMFHLVCLAWVFFRAHSFDDASTMLSTLFSRDWSLDSGAIADNQVLLVLAFPLLHWLSARGEWVERAFEASTVRYATAQVALLVALALFAPGGAIPFIYFQF